MKNLIYVSLVAFIGLLACGAPAEQKEAATQETVDSMEVSVETIEMDSVAPEEEVSE